MHAFEMLEMHHDILGSVQTCRLDLLLQMWYAKFCGPAHSFRSLIRERKCEVMEEF